uniref:Uncharacterized protein n=1 Tax=Cannabis sativa TaxID=3483 RepID=A0A803PK63_CANSA
MGGTTVGGRLWKDTKRNSTYSMKDFLDRAGEFIKLEEAKWNAKGLNHANGNKNGANTSGQGSQSQGSTNNSGFNNGKRTNNDNGRNNFINNKKPNKASSLITTSS